MQTTLAQWVGTCGVQWEPLFDALKEELPAQPVQHADETPAATLKLGIVRPIVPIRGATARRHRTQQRRLLTFWLSSTQNESRAGHHAGRFPGHWRGTLVSEDRPYQHPLCMEKRKPFQYYGQHHLIWYFWPVLMMTLRCFPIYDMVCE